MIVCTELDNEFINYEKLVNNRNNNFSIKQIFNDYWNKFINKYPNLNIRDTVFLNVNRMLKCKTKDLGYTIYKCDNCQKEKFIPHTCKSRICTSCGNKYNKQRETSILLKLYNYKHRHIVFTIPKELRIYFRKDRKRFSYLFKAAEMTIKTFINYKYKATPAFASILHTFGRDLSFNPHIHMILLEGGFTIKYKTFIKFNFFSYSSFRKRFMKVLLDLLEKDLGKSKFKNIKNKIYLNHNKGFYVYAPPSKFNNYRDLIKYVCRYVARPVMSESRIINYDKDYITFWYERHNDDVTVIEKLHIYDFIKRLIIHIPEKNYKQIRFYGAYHNSSKAKSNIKLVIQKEKHNILRNENRWRNLIIKSYSKDPLVCPICNQMMKYDKTTFP